MDPTMHKIRWTITGLLTNFLFLGGNISKSNEIDTYIVVK